MRVFWDTNVFIYLFEDYGPLTELAQNLTERIFQRGAEIVTSSLALGELLVVPRQESASRADSLETLLRSIATVAPFDIEAARHFAQIRADRRIAAPDAIHLACAAAAGVDLFVTNDSRLSRRIVPGVPIMTSLAAVPI
jgi:predicted nucleic acid-binding protein